MDTRKLRDRLQAIDGAQCRPPLAEAAVADFEQRHGVTLPAAYRRFLTEVADGVESDAGPMYSLAQAETEAALAGPLAGAFPYSTAYATLISGRLAAAAPGTFSDVMSAPDIMAGQHKGGAPGNLVLADFGCGHYSVLVLAGEQAGKIWRLGDFDAPETTALYEPGTDAMTQLDFEAWVGHWAALIGG